MRLGFKNSWSKIYIFFIYLTQINFMCFSAGIWDNTSQDELKKLPQESLSNIVSLQRLWKNDAFLCLLFPITHQKGSQDLSWFGNAE